MLGESLFYLEHPANILELISLNIILIELQLCNPRVRIEKLWALDKSWYKSGSLLNKLYVMGKK